jgi:hypothetical protein
MAKSSPEKLAQALRANLKRRKGAKGGKPPAPPPEPAPKPPKNVS